MADTEVLLYYRTLSTRIYIKTLLGPSSNWLRVIVYVRYLGRDVYVRGWGRGELCHHHNNII